MKAIALEVFYNILILGAVALVTAGGMHRAFGEKACGRHHGQAAALAATPEP